MVRKKRPADLRARVLEVGRSRYILLSFPRASGDGLTEAERHVMLAVLAGLSNADIARMRGSSPRTVANQLGAIFRKLGVRSRSELAARVGHASAGQPEAPGRGHQLHARGDAQLAARREQR